jgi:hypothetical protein
MQIATILGEHHLKVVPEIAVTGDGGAAGMANVMGDSGTVRSP